MMQLATFKIDWDVLQRLCEEHLKLIGQVSRRRPVDRGWIYDLDASFHEIIATFSGNAFLIQAIQKQNRLRRLIEYGGYTRLERVKTWAKEHLAILDALQREQFERTAECMRCHLTNAMHATQGLQP
jgi:DNA-binding GntR family transcriptional regulator